MFTAAQLPFLADGDAIKVKSDYTLGEQWHAGSPRGVIERLSGEYLYDNEAREMLKDTAAYIMRLGDQIIAFFWQPTSERQMLRQGMDMDFDEWYLPDVGRVQRRTVGYFDQKTGRLNRA